MCLLFIMVFGLKGGRKLRKSCFDTQIALGDAIAMRKGTYLARRIKKVGIRNAAGMFN